MKTAAALALLCVLFAPVAQARSLRQDDVLAARLLPGWQVQGGNHMAALQLNLLSGWKTYWRSPGEAGIPPEFDWSGSQNVASVRYHWPTPTVFHLNGMQTVGYRDALTLPIEVTPQDPSRPVHLKLAVDLGICSDICLPAFVQVQADLPAQGGAPDPAIRAALAARPLTAAEAGVQGIACRVEPIRDGLRLTARIALPAAREEVVLFEAANSRVWISESESHREGGVLIGAADLVPPGKGAFALDRQGVTVTVLGGEHAVEIKGCPAP